MDFYEALDKLEETVTVDDDEVINQYLQRKGKVRKKGYVYKIDRDDPKNMKIKEIPASQAAQSSQAALKLAQQVKGLVNK